MIQSIEPLPIITSVQSQFLSDSQPPSKINTKPPEQNSQIPNSNIFQKPQPIGIYNFGINKSQITSFEQNIDEAVSAFIDQNKNNIIQYVVQEVQKKFEEKITPMTEEITKLKDDFNSLYEEEWSDFKQLNVLNDCHNNIMELNNKMNIMNENIEKYNENIKGFNVADNRLQFLSKLNKDLDEFISGIGSYIYTPEKKEVGLVQGNIDVEMNENLHKIEKEMGKQEKLNHELDNVFYETMEMLKDINKDVNTGENNNIMDSNNNNIMNFNDILNNFKSTVNAFDSKFNYEKPLNNNLIPNNNFNINNDNRKNDRNNIFDELPNFFE